tara:strand:+ start:493 stop:738 length:246 start_codon:yes stop_codon:yes gene_type:complete
MKHLLLLFFLISSIQFGGWIRTDAAIPGWTPPENYREDPMEIVKEEFLEEADEEQVEKEQMSVEDIFGDEQVFPFPPGLGN